MQAKRELSRKHVRGWMSSGLSCKAYAARAGINHHTLSWWKARLLGSRKRSGQGAEKATFVEVLPAVIETVRRPPSRSRSAE